MASTRAVLFDLDETLFDHSHSARSALIQLRDSHEALQCRPFEELELEFHRLLDEVHLRLLQGEITVEQSREERMLRLFAGCGVTITRTEALEHISRFRAAYQESRRPVPGAIPLLERLHTLVTVGIVSNNLTEEQEGKLRHTGMDHLIDVLVTSESAGAIKPEPGIFEEAIRQAGCRPAEAVMVGDSWEADIVGARDAGLRAVWFNRYRRPCPDPSMAAEIESFEPVETTLSIVGVGDRAAL
jgi:HAD superfamily hydrolase (TIGR01549 family)